VGVPVTSGAEEMVPTGGELTLFQAVDPVGSDHLSLCRSSPVRDVRRDLIGAWQRPKQAVSAGRPLSSNLKGDNAMIVLGADMHKSSHTLAAVAAITGELLGDKTAQVGARGFKEMLGWARALGTQRVWALEDCRHVSGSFERFLIERGERVVRVPTRLMASSRRASRERGKSDRIDALAVARAALAEGIDTLPGSVR
jgi:Transposase